MLYDQQQRTFQIYVTDSLKNVTEAIAGLGGNKVDIQRYADMISQKPKKQLSAEEIIENLNLSAGLIMIE